MLLCAVKISSSLKRLVLEGNDIDESILHELRKNLGKSAISEVAFAIEAIDYYDTDDLLEDVKIGKVRVKSGDITKGELTDTSDVNSETIKKILEDDEISESESDSVSEPEPSKKINIFGRGSRRRRKKQETSSEGEESSGSGLFTADDFW